MVLSLLDTGFIRVTVRYVRPLKKGGPLSYQRRIPADLRHHYQGKTFIRTSLKTRDPLVAAQKAEALASQHDALWRSLRSPEGREMGLTTPEALQAAKALLAHLGLRAGALHRPKDESRNARETHAIASVDDLDPVETLDDYFEGRYGAAYQELRNDPQYPRELMRAQWTATEREMVRLLEADPRKPRALLSDARDVYLRDHDRGRDPAFIAATDRALAHVLDNVGDLPLHHYLREHAVTVRDALRRGGSKTATVRRRLNAIVAVINVGLREFNLSTRDNPFANLKIPNQGQDAKRRIPFTSVELQGISAASKRADDDIRHIVGLLIDTGARLGEIVGLRVSDVMVEYDVPHLRIQPHLSLGRRLKNASSQRSIPLVGVSLWAASRALEASSKAQDNGGWLFPRYASAHNIRATSASQTVNKWLRSSLSIPKTAHSFRHSMRDRMRLAEIPEPIQDALGGWGNRTVGQGYGEGYGLIQLKESMDKIVLPDAAAV